MKQQWYYDGILRTISCKQLLPGLMDVFFDNEHIGQIERERFTRIIRGGTRSAGLLWTGRLKDGDTVLREPATATYRTAKNAAYELARLWYLQHRSTVEE